MRGKLIISIIAIIVLSFFSLSFAQERVETKIAALQTKPGQVPADRLEKAKIVELPDLVVDSIWLDNQCHINFKLRNVGKGNISDGEHRESVVRVQFGSEIKDLLLGRIDPNGVLKRAGGSVSFDTQILLKAPLEVRVIVDFNRRIQETDPGERNNEKTVKLTPQCASAVQSPRGIPRESSFEETKSIKSGAPLTRAPKASPSPGGEVTYTAGGITVTNPAQDSTWEWEKSYAIQWKSSPSALGILKIVLFGEKGNQVQQIGLNQDQGTYNWKVPSNIPNGKYFIRISTLNNLISGDSKPFYISDGKLIMGQLIPVVLKSAITVTHPGKGDVWIPLKKYTIKWSWTVEGGLLCKNPYGECVGCNVDVWLIPTTPSASSKKILLLYKICTPGNFSMGKITYRGEYEGVVPNLESGNYFVRVESKDKTEIYGESQPFTVKSTLSSDTALLDPSAQTQGKVPNVDLVLVSVFFDGEGNIKMKIANNLGENFSGELEVTYEINTFGTQPTPMGKGQFIWSNFSLKAKEVKTVDLKEWGGFNFSTFGWDAGSSELGIPSRFIPVNSRPLWVNVKIMPIYVNEINPQNNSFAGKMCMIQAPDIGTKGEIKLVFSPKEWLYIGKGTTNEIHEAKLKWISKDTFEANVEVGLWNFGCTAKTFDCWLYVDKLPGQFLQKVTLQPGQVDKFNQLIKIKVPSKCGDHSLVFIADPDEHKNEPYPNSYMNNFINVTLRILCGGTIKGSGW
ncbi:MAG: hypothetical protein A2156_08055 [Deltaproteobacteria bacterium RBG_16_48_10]|nr:MAG: hypothetical protein A2156_08055 [Deltaproteobacteria bacterium RBG_16_48_10]